MSRGQRPRTPAEFPRMKHRAAGRQVRARRRVLEHFLALGAASTPSPFDAFARVIEEFATQVVQPIVDRFRAAFAEAARRSDYALVPAPPAAPLGASRHDVEWHDPTHGTIDRDVQDAVSRSFPNVPLATRVAIERTAQDRKDRGLSW